MSYVIYIQIICYGEMNDLQLKGTPVCMHERSVLRIKRRANLAAYIDKGEVG